MRILHIIGTLNPASGGPASSVVTLIEFGPAGTLNEVVTLDDPEAPFLKRLTFQVTALGPTRTRYGFRPRLIAWLRANRTRFDAVFVHGLWQYCGFAAWRALGGQQPYMVFSHGMLDPYFKHAFPLKHFKKWLYWLLAEYWVLRGAHSVLFTCDAEADLARQSFWLNRWTSQVVPYGASIPPGDTAGRQQLFLSQFPNLRGRRYLLFLGRVTVKKGCDMLVDAFIQTAALDPGLDLVIAGPDESKWRSALQRPLDQARLSERVHWTGMLEGELKWGAFLGAEAFILPSHQENFGIAVAEAMACGKAVLLSDKVNIAPDIAAAGAGMVEQDTALGTRRLFERWITLSTEDRQLMEHRARLCFEQRYDMRINAREMARLLDQVTRTSFDGPLHSSAAAKPSHPAV